MSKGAKLLGKLIEKKLDGRPQSWLAETSGISQSKISRIISGTAEPDFEEVGKLATGLGVEIADILAVVFQDIALIRTKLAMEIPRINPIVDELATTVVRALKSEFDQMRSEAAIRSAQINIDEPDSFRGLSDEALEVARAYDDAGPGRKTLVRDTLDMPDAVKKTKKKTE